MGGRGSFDGKWSHRPPSNDPQRDRNSGGLCCANRLMGFTLRIQRGSLSIGFDAEMACEATPSWQEGTTGGLQ